MMSRNYGLASRAIVDEQGGSRQAIAQWRRPAMNAPPKNTSLVGTPLEIPEDLQELNEVAPNAGSRPYELAVVLVPGFPQVCLSSMIEPLRLANYLSARDLFRWRLVSLAGKAVECASGIPIGVNGDIESERRSLDAGRLPDAAIVCSGDGIEDHCSAAVMSLLRLYARRGVWLYGVGTGTWLLAKSGLLAGVRCTIHWPKLAALSETFDRLSIDDALFVRDGPIVTCAGGFAAFDMVVDIIEREFGSNLARAVCRHLTTDHRRDGAISQAAPPGLRLAGTSEKLIRAVRLMERNLEEPLSLEQIARTVVISRRQIERLFHRYLSMTPHRYYLSLRLARARQLLNSTNLPILDIAIACGFESSSHFAKTCQDYFGKPPSGLRGQHREPVSSHAREPRRS
ncbi:GlxA family transcriptional regulator [Mesorhizobium sp.]|uniref:GlxA family transcriptional regulator n=1 Tax=Mesorhizobium sp. TaxID=1871066 RepID=UPI001218CD11|nr:GlxA family transcriptional regulator [Mesorhizobium sp.]TIL29444.1 MAG: GlxA family transcriptional regulator [Mesorhizobium sp.]TIL49659.1 MAG: GlxA family transcriptional regulator [Mesorhizobium sp.]